MKKDEVPQDSASIYGGQHKLLYAVDDSGQYISVHSAGWDVESAATRAVIAEINQARDEAWIRARQGETATLEFHMYNRRMDLALLAQTTGLFQWRVRRHLRPTVFSKLSATVLGRYADALGMTKEELQSLPETCPSE